MKIQQHLVLVGVREPIRSDNVYRNSSDGVVSKLIGAETRPRNASPRGISIGQTPAVGQRLRRPLIGLGAAQRKLRLRTDGVRHWNHSCHMRCALFVDEAGIAIGCFGSRGGL